MELYVCVCEFTYGCTYGCRLDACTHTHTNTPLHLRRKSKAATTTEEEEEGEQQKNMGIDVLML